MKYPKRIMTRLELMHDPGFTERYLDRAYNTPGQRFAWKDNPAAKNCVIKFDTEEFERWRQKDMEMQERARNVRTAVL